MNILFRDEAEINIFSDEGKLRECHQQMYPKRMAKGCYLNRKETIKGGIFGHQKGRKNMTSKMLVNTTDFPSP